MEDNRASGAETPQPGGTVRRVQEPTRKPAILAGDQEREHSSELLSQAVVEGRLTLEEFSDRVGRAQAARTREELALLTQDLPAPSAAPAPARSTEAVPTPHRHVAAFSRLVRSGPWELAERSEFRCIFGTITLDLSQARLAGSAVALEIFNLFGTVTVLVPEGVDVSVTGGGLFASQVVQPPASRPVQGAPRLLINARGPGGTTYVRSKKTR